MRKPILVMLISIMLGTLTVRTVSAQPPMPTSAAALFQPNVPGINAVDLCSGTGSFCQPAGSASTFSLTSRDGVFTDALGSLYFNNGPRSDIGTCLVGGNPLPVTDSHLYRLTASGTFEMIATFHGSCGDGYLIDVALGSIALDAINGDLYVNAEVIHSAASAGQAIGYFHVKISGLPTLLDIILSYQPPSTLSFNVPVRPEGLPGADSFSVYSGDLDTVSDLAQATPLQCTVPAGRPPVPGEHLAVADTLPDPSPGAGRYYVTAVRDGDLIRAGRSTIGGVMQGRNAAAMPSACQ
jgi:hypothetical protein